MPVIKSAIKKLRRDKKREKQNDDFRKNLQAIIRAAKKQKTPKKINEAFSAIDKAVKKNLIHKNRAARIKSSLSKPAAKTTKVPSSAKTAKKPPTKIKTRSTPKKTKTPIK